MKEKIGAVITGGDFQALGVLRTLARKNIPIILLDSDHCISRYSRFKKKFFKSPPPSAEEYLNNVTDSDNEPIFKTDELPVDVRRQILVRAKEIESSVWQKAARRMFENLPIIRTIAGWLFASQFGRWLFFKNTFTRNLINRIRYRIGK